METATILVHNISFASYISSDLERRRTYDYYLNNGMLESKDLFNLGSFTDQSFGFVKDMQEYLNYLGLSWEIFFDEMEKKTGIKRIDLASRSLFDLQCARLHIKEQVETINELEISALSHSPDINEEMAGLDDFAKYRSFIQFDNLAGGDLLKFEAIRKLPYDICFTKLKLEIDKKIFDKKLSRIMNQKNKTNDNKNTS